MKVLLEFEDVSTYLQYNARNEAFLHNKLAPNPECKDSNCLLRQAEKKGKEGFLDSRKKVVEAKRASQNTFVKEDLNEWGIELIDEDEGIKAGESIKKEDVEALDVNSLMDKLKGLN